MPRKPRAKKPPELPSTAAVSRNGCTVGCATGSVGSSTCSQTSRRPMGDTNNNSAAAGPPLGKNIEKGKQPAPNPEKHGLLEKASRDQREEKLSLEPKIKQEERFRGRYGQKHVRRILPMVKPFQPKICDMIPELNDVEEDHFIRPLRRTAADNEKLLKTGSSFTSEVGRSAPKAGNDRQPSKVTKLKGRGILDMSFSCNESESWERSLDGARSHINEVMSDVQHMFSRPLCVPAKSSTAESFSVPAPGRPVLEEYYACGQACGLLRMWTDFGAQDEFEEFAGFGNLDQFGEKEDGKDKHVTKRSRRPKM